MAEPEVLTVTPRLQVERLDIVGVDVLLRRLADVLGQMAGLGLRTEPLDRLRADALDASTRLAALVGSSSPGPVESFRHEHPRKYDAVDCVYYGCANPVCQGDGVDWELHGAMWADRSGKP